jgi:peptidyl-prolyl cis-trans isomerase SurA
VSLGLAFARILPYPVVTRAKRRPEAVGHRTETTLADFNFRAGGAVLTVLATLLFGVLAPAARAQSIMAVVNGDAITSEDVAERAKVLKLLSQPSTPDAALESMIKSRVIASEINKFGINVKPNEFGPTINFFAEKAHVTPEVLGQRLAMAQQSNQVNKKHLENFFAIHQAFAIYARARNRAVEVSEADLNAEIARDPKLARQQTYILRQIVIAVQPPNDPGALQAAAKKMEALRNQFKSCEEGVKLARLNPDIIVRDEISRTTGAIGDALATALDKMTVGTLSPPSRDQLGLASIALCSRKPAAQDAMREIAQGRVIARYIERDSDKLYQDIRANAVVQKR